MKIEIFCDGAVRSDGKDRYAAAACAFVMYKNKKQAYSAYRMLSASDVTSNEAEYEAVIFALISAIAMDCHNPIIYTDSATVYNQITHRWACKSPRLVPLLFTIKKIQQTFNFTIQHVSRKYVAIADQLCNEILDEFQGLVPSEDLDI